MHPNWLKYIAAVLPLMFAPHAAGQQTVPDAHMTIPDPASLSGARAEGVYQAIRRQLMIRYLRSGDPVAAQYQSWTRYSTAPYRSSSHGERFLNNYANSLAPDYGKFEAAGSMPEGALIAKDSFVVTDDGKVMTGPFFLMEKREEGFNPESGDWLYMMIRADGSLAGITGGQGSRSVKFCADCHNKAPENQDSLYFLPKEVRRVDTKLR